MRFRIVRLKLQGNGELCNGLFQFLLEEQRQTIVILGQRISRIQTHGFFQLGFSFDELSETGDTGTEPGPSALELIEARDLSRQVAAAVSALPQEQREVVVLKEYQGLTFLEIAEALDVPLSTVKTRLYRGLGQLRQELVRQGVRGGSPVPAPTS